MSGFDASWLTLREPVDRAARDGALVTALAGYLATIAGPSLLDIGCGTGSTWSSLSGALPEGTRWHLLDHDPLLLDEARRRIGADERVRVGRHDLNDLDALPLEGVSVVTASALFDLCSRDFCAALVACLADRGCGLYAALTYDGVMTWSKPHPLDEAVVTAFNRHQRGDKGFGPAVGPDATDTLANAWRERAGEVRIGSSPWRMDSRLAALQRAFLDGFRQPLREVGSLGAADIEDWLAFRLSRVEDPGCLCVVGHTDLLALPSRTA